MKLRKVILLFMIVGFGAVIEGVNKARTFVISEDGFDILRNLQFDGDFPFGNRGFRGPSSDFTESQTIEASGIVTIDVTNAYGDVTVRRGHDANAMISVGLRKEVFTRKSEGAESVSNRVKLDMHREGSVLKVSTTRDARGDYRMKTHFDIETPQPLEVRIVNRHGKILVEGAKTVDLSGEFDEMRVQNVTGECTAKNRHGDLEVISAAEGCKVEVEYGNAHVEKLQAPSRVSVTHGDLNAIDLGGALTAILRFGDLQAKRISGGLNADGQHSSLKIDDVKGDVEVTNQGDVDMQNILGRVTVENQRGHVKLLKAGASVLIKNTFEEVAASDIGGFLEISNQHGNIRAERFVAGAKLETDSEDVDVADFNGPLNIVTKRGDVSVKPLRKGLAPIDVSVDIGDISLALSETVNAILDASVDRGDVEGTVGALKTSEQGKRVLRATIGAGGPLLKLRSRLGDIKLSNENDLDVSEPDSPDGPEIEMRWRSAPRPEHGLDPLPVAPKAVPAPAAAPQPRLPRAAKPIEPSQPPTAPVKPSPEGL
ncbi:MAG: DUF4097 family beta strand repeat-containing protein [Vicinamibacteria bacterium]